MSKTGGQVIGLYNADSSIIGELKYAFNKLAGSGGCALCDITHGINPFGRSEWRAACQSSLRTVQWLHRDEAEAPLDQLTLPCVIELTDQGDIRVLLDRRRLMACNGSIERFIEALSQALNSP